MITYQDTFGQVPVVEQITCEFHRQHPSKSCPGCTCHANYGWRKATPEERRENLWRKLQELNEQAAQVQADIEAVKAELEASK